MTLLLRGGAEQFIDEAERSLQDAILSTRRLVKVGSAVHPCVFCACGVRHPSSAARVRGEVAAGGLADDCWWEERSRRPHT